MANTYQAIATTTLGSTASSYTFSSIPNTYTDLVLIANAVGSASDVSIEVYFNGDNSSGLYSETILDGNGSSVTTGRETSVNAMALGSVGTSQSTSIIQIQNYSNNITYKTGLGRGNNTVTRVRAYAGLWRNTAVINSLSVYLSGSATFSAGSTFTLYGIKAA